MWLRRQGPSLFVQTPAKLNLALKVLGRRQDGFHHLETVMVSVRLFDTLRLTSLASARIELNCTACAAAVPPADDRNLVVRAARLLQAHAAPEQGATISLLKRIPMEAGMGGGSSDAAATLVGLNALWNLGLSREELHHLAAQLGSDINFFLDSPIAAICRGRGESVTPIPLPKPMHFVIVKPPVGLSTGAVFAEWSRGNLTGLAEGAAIKLVESQERRWEFPGTIQNDLETPARRLSPETDRLLQRLEGLNAVATGMTGSGSACFAVCRTARQAAVIARQVRGWRVGQVFQVSSGA